MRAQDHVFPAIRVLAGHGHYLHRLTALAVISALADLCTPDMVTAMMISVVFQLAGDRVPNLRFKAAQTIEELVPFVSPA